MILATCGAIIQMLSMSYLIYVSDYSLY